MSYLMKFDRIHGFRFFDVQMTAKKVVTDCKQNNELKKRTCFEGFIASKMNCSTPWETDKTDKEPCGSAEDLKAYMNLRLDIYTGKYKEDLHECLLQNCETKAWTARKMANYDDYTLKELKDLVGISRETQNICILTFTRLAHEVKKIWSTFIVVSPLPCAYSTLQYEASEEYFLYGVANFVSDTGGTMGLFLGASLLSMFYFIIDVLVKGINACNTKRGGPF